MIDKVEDLEDIIWGASLLATGGGGSLSYGLRLARRIAEGGGLKVVAVEELSDDDIVVSPYFIGSMGTALDRGEEETKSMLIEAISVLSEELGAEILGIVASELGGGNTAVALYAAYLLNRPIVDGDLMGRAGPELHQSTAHVYGVPVTPSVIVSPTGSTIVITRIPNVDFYEEISRHIAYLSGGWSLVVDTPLRGRTARSVIISGTLSLCLKLGRAVRESRARGANAVDAIMNILKGWKIFEGKVTESNLKNTGRFLEGTITVESAEGKLKIYVKNEYLLVWLDDEPIAMPPDLIMLVDSVGNPILSNMVREGLDVIVIASKAPNIWRTAKGLELFGPKHFGFNYNYIPVEKLVEKLMR
ncbi:MAG TPA: DUF917 domain-containing protein [Sulfolobales archaeon]|nr:DUF917 domain-containing protein [Sulfolobales archaeon]